MSLFRSSALKASPVKAAENFKRNLLVRLPRESGDFGFGQLRPGRGQIQAAIRRQPGQQHIGEIRFRRLSPS